MRYKVSWWIHGAGRIVRGHDIVDADKELDEDDAEDLIEEDLDRLLAQAGIGPYNYAAKGPFTPNLPNFFQKHGDLTIEARHSEISNWGVLKVTRIKPIVRRTVGFLGVETGVGSLPGWSYMGRRLLENFPSEQREKLSNVGDAITVEEKDRYIRYVNRGLVTASGKRPIIDFYRRFKPRLGM